MKIELSTKLSISNPGIEQLAKLIEKNGKISFDFKKGKIIIDDVSSSIMETIFENLRTFFDISHLEITSQKKFKIRNDEKALAVKKEQIKQEISKKPSSISSQVKAYILAEKVFTLTKLRKDFPNTNFGTLRSYVNHMKKDNIIVEIEKGKYSVR